MKIIKQGKWEKKVTCCHCRTKMLIDEDDVEYRRVGCYDDFEGEYYITCPSCSTELILTNWVELPCSARKKAEEKYRDKYGRL